MLTSLPGFERYFFGLSLQGGGISPHVHQYGTLLPFHIAQLQFQELFSLQQTGLRKRELSPFLHMKPSLMMLLVHRRWLSCRHQVLTGIFSGFRGQSQGHTMHLMNQV